MIKTCKYYGLLGMFIGDVIKLVYQQTVDFVHFYLTVSSRSQLRFGFAAAP